MSWLTWAMRKNTKAPVTTLSLSEKARSCHDCLCWLEHCNAECCQQFHFPIKPTSDVAMDGLTVRIRIPMSSDRRWYFELHGVQVRGNDLLIPKVDCHFTSATQLSVHKRCRLLTAQNLCAGHPEGKPDICKNVTLKNAKNGNCDLTPNCLFTYKT